MDINEPLFGQPDGDYEIHLEPRGLWWCLFDCDNLVEDEEGGGSDRVLHQLSDRRIPRVMLETDDHVVIRVKGGRVFGG